MGKVWAKRVYKLRGFFNYVYSLAMLRYTKANLSFLRRNLSQHAIDRMHIGCGDVILDGWLNVLYERRQEYGRLKHKGNGWFLNYDLLRDWPVDDNSLSFVAGSHMIEHLDLNHGMILVKQAYQALKGGGVIRLSCPDLETYARHYVNGDKKFFDHPLVREWCAFKAAETSGQIFIAKAYDSGGAHKWFYDFDSLKDILERAGFAEVKKVSRLQGQVPGLELLEPPQRELETVYVEATKR